MRNRFQIMARGLIVCFALIHNACTTCLAQSDVLLPSPYVVGGDVWKYPTLKVRISNSSDTAVSIPSMRFWLSDIKIDKRPMPVFEVLSFGDGMVLKVTDLGWGDFDCPPVTLMPENLLRSKGFLTGPFQSGVFSQFAPQRVGQTCGFMRHLINHDSFGLWSLHGRPMSIADDCPRPLRDFRLIEMETEDIFSDSVEDEDWRGFNGEMWGAYEADASRTVVELFGGYSFGKVPLHLRELQSVQMQPLERFLDRMLGTQMAGGLSRGVQLSFGNVIDNFPADSADRDVYGLTVDFRGVGEASLDVSTVGLKIPAGRAVTLNAMVITEKSSSFKLHCQPRTAGGVLPAFSLPPGAESCAEALVPRLLEYGHRDTERFADVWNDQYANVGFSDGVVLCLEPASGRTAADVFELNRRFRETLLFNSCLPGKSEATQRLLDGTSHYFETFFAQCANDPLLREAYGPSSLWAEDWRQNVRVCFAILARLRPAVAVDLAVRFYNSGNDRRLMSVVLVLSETREILLRRLSDVNLEAVEANLHQMGDRQSVFLAAMLNSDALRSALGAFSNSSVGLAFAFNYRKERDLRHLIDDCIENWNGGSVANEGSERLEGAELSALIDGLTVFEERAFVSTVVRLVERAKNDPGESELLLSAVRYLKMCGYSNDSMYLALSRCAFSSAVREAAEEAMR